MYIYGAPILDVSRSHTTTQHSRQDSSGRVISSSQRPLPDNTRHSQQTNIHAPGGIRTHSLKLNNLTLILLTWRKWGAPNNASKYQMGFNSEFKGLKRNLCFHNTKRNKFARTEISLIITCEVSELMGHGTVCLGKCFPTYRKKACISL